MGFKRKADPAEVEEIEDEEEALKESYFCRTIPQLFSPTAHGFWGLQP